MSMSISLVLVSVSVLVLVLALVSALVLGVSWERMYQCSGRRRALSEAKGERVRNERIDEWTNQWIIKQIKIQIASSWQKY